MELTKMRGDMTFLLRVTDGGDWFAGSVTVRGGTGETYLATRSWHLAGVGGDVTVPPPTAFPEDPSVVHVIIGGDTFSLAFGARGEPCIFSRAAGASVIGGECTVVRDSPRQWT